MSSFSQEGALSARETHVINSNKIKHSQLQIDTKTGKKDEQTRGTNRSIKKELRL